MQGVNPHHVRLAPKTRSKGIGTAGGGGNYPEFDNTKPSSKKEELGIKESKTFDNEGRYKKKIKMNRRNSVTWTKIKQNPKLLIE